MIQWLMASYWISKQYATWNPSDKDSLITLSNWNLTIIHSAWSTWASVRSTISKSSGKWYWEYTIDSGSTVLWGIWNSTASLANFVWWDANWYGYYSTNGNKANSGLTAYWASYVAWDIIGVALDMTAWTVTFYKNNVSQGTAFTMWAGTFFAMNSVLTNVTVSMTANFGATAFTYAPPSGFNSWLYN